MPTWPRSLTSALRVVLNGLVVLVLFLSVSCSAAPSTKTVEGQVLRHPQARFQLVLPPGWQVQQSRLGFSLVREEPFGGGYPTLNLRRLAAGELEDLRFDGRSHKGPAGDVVYRYQGWRNSRGSGYRMNAIITTPRGMVFADASVWDPSTKLDRSLFEQVFWPLINSMEIDSPGPSEAPPSR